MSFREPTLRAAGERSTGFTVIELLMTITLIGLIGAMAIPNFLHLIYGIKVDRAIVDIKIIEAEIMRYRDREGALPASLDDLEMNVPFDPFGNPYSYYPFPEKGFMKRARMDFTYRPINSEFDLYSIGRDGITKKQIWHKASADDIVRASDGAFVGLAAEINTK